MPLVATNDFKDLPQEPEARWLQLRDLVEKRLDNDFDMNNGGHETYDLLEYVEVLTAAAEELGIGSLREISPSNVREEFDTFRANVAALATRLSLRVSEQNPRNSVALARPTRKKILSQIENLRATLNNSELSEVQKDKAARLIDELQILIILPRTDMARACVVIAYIGAALLSAPSFLADLPPAIGTISALIGADKLEEESEQALIEDAKTKLQIQDLRDKPNEETSSGTGSESDDEIPF